MNKSFRFNDPELVWLAEIKDLTGYSETAIIRLALCFFYYRIVSSDLMDFQAALDKYNEAADYFKYKSLQKKVYINAVQPLGCQHDNLTN